MNNTSTLFSNFHKGRIYALTLNASLGFAFWAYNFSIFNSLQEYLEKYIFPTISTTEISFIASSLDFGAIIGSLLAGIFVSKWGRRKTMIVADIVGIIGSTLTLIAVFEVMLLGRLVSGFVGGVNTVVVAMYLVELSPLPMCGATGSLSIIVLELLAFLSLVLGFAVPSVPKGGVSGQIWRILLWIPALLNIIRLLCLTVFFRYDTPFYCIEKNKKEEAMKALSKVFRSNVPQEYERIAQDVETATFDGVVRFKDLFRNVYRKGFLISLILAMLQQFCGTGAVFVFSNDIFSKSTSNPVLYSTLLGVINLLAVIVSFKFIEKFGRRTLILFGVISIGVLLLAFGLIAALDSESSPILKFLLICWPIFYQASLGSLTFLYISETLPDVGVGFCTSANWMSGFLISQFYLQSVEKFGLGVPFIFFACLCFVSAVIFSKNLVETKEKTKTEIIAAYSKISPSQIAPIKEDFGHHGEEVIMNNRREQQDAEVLDSEIELPERNREEPPIVITLNTQSSKNILCE